MKPSNDDGDLISRQSNQTANNTNSDSSSSITTTNNNNNNNNKVNQNQKRATVNEVKPPAPLRPKTEPIEAKAGCISAKRSRQTTTKPQQVNSKANNLKLRP